jgi:hypothetical protein
VSGAYAVAAGRRAGHDWQQCQRQGHVQQVVQQRDLSVVGHRHRCRAETHYEAANFGEHDPKGHLQGEVRERVAIESEEVDAAGLVLLAGVCEVKESG